jgi:hypothetical protein
MNGIYTLTGEINNDTAYYGDTDNTFVPQQKIDDFVPLDNSSFWDI